ncbi:MAG: DUF4919 domain-containing protein [Myxococcota bacterium]
MRNAVVTMGALLVIGCAHEAVGPAAGAASGRGADLRGAGSAQDAEAMDASVDGLPSLIPESVAPPAPRWGDPVDYNALREAYGPRADFDARCDATVQQSVARALAEERFEDVIELTQRPLERCPVFAQLHLWRALALLDLGRTVEADVHRAWFLGLTQSVLDSGDGQTPETPYVTIAVWEEYATLMRLGLEPRGQVLLDGPRMLDVLSAEDEEGNARSLYFDPQWHFIRLMHRLQ